MAEKTSLDYLRYLRPTHLITSAVMYLLGTGFVRYLGGRLDFTTFLIGFAWMILLQLGMFFLGDYFQSPFDTGLFGTPARKEKKPAESDPEMFTLLLYSSVALLAGAAVLVVLLGVRGNLDLSNSLLMATYFVLHILIVVPGISLNYSGVGEFVTSIILVALPPVLAYNLQVDNLHRFIILSVFPIFPLNLALILVMRLKRYKDDLINNRETLLVRFGWVQGIFIHNLLVFSGFLLFGLSLLFGMPIKLIWTVFLTIPIGIYSIWYLSNLEDGAAVRWSLITLLSLVTFFLPVYLFTYSIWIR
jgi:1,4-dihydroxy-2-naphthoate octaprenyltransferase